VKGDGHCGFLVLASLHGTFVDDHYIIHLDLSRELTGDRYLQLIGLNKQFSEVKHVMPTDWIGFVLRDKSVIMPYINFLIVQKYKYVVIFLSVKKWQSKTFILHGASSERDWIMCLAHVNSNHFMLINFFLFVFSLYLILSLFMCNNHNFYYRYIWRTDVKIHPTYILWNHSRRDDARTWEPRDTHRIVSYNELTHVTDNEIIGHGDFRIVEILEKDEDDKMVVDNWYCFTSLSFKR